MVILMAVRTKCDQVVQCIVAELDSASLDDVRASLSTSRNFGTANHLVRALVGEVNCNLRR